MMFTLAVRANIVIYIRGEEGSENMRVGDWRSIAIGRLEKWLRSGSLNLEKLYEFDF